MHVRMTTIHGDASRQRAVVDVAENQGRPAIEATAGNLGFATLTGSGGTFIGASYWESAEAAAASQESLAGLRDEVAAAAGGTASMETFEVAVARRMTLPAAGAIVRVLRVEVDPAGVENAIALYSDRVLPALVEHPGMCSAQLLVDRAAGKAVAITVWDDEVALEKAQHALEEIRDEVASATGGRFAEPEQYTLVRSTVQLR